MPAKRNTPASAAPRSRRPVAQAPRSPWAGLSRSDCFFEDASQRDLITRATAYVQAGVCLHLSGPAGLGKTTLALRIAEELGRPVAFMVGNQWLGASDFIGREVGQTTRTVIDTYIQSVRRTDAETRADWKGSILAEAMRNGHTLVYDEFTRASPEANALLLSVLEEGVLITADRAAQQSRIEAHPEFRVILTSNPNDYTGVNGAPDALMDRVLTLPVPEPTAERLAGIVAARTGLDTKTAARIVARVDEAGVTPDPRHGSRLRTNLMIARIAAFFQRDRALSDERLAEIVRDVLQGRGHGAPTVTPLNRTTAARKVAT
jgi:gas vesicle protein GvpN